MKFIETQKKGTNNRMILEGARFLRVAAFLILFGAVIIGCKSPPTVIGNPPQCPIWSPAAIEQLKMLLDMQERGDIDIFALEIELGRMEQTCQALRVWQ